MISYLILGIVLVVLDQLAKVWALDVLAPVGSIDFLPFLRFTYVENRGAAFGILTGQRWILSAVSIIVVALCIYIIAARRLKTRAENISVALIAAGGAGNLIDRLTRGFVVDYIDINALFSYPMFNLADCCVVAGAILLVIAAFLSEKKSAHEKEQDSDS